uniref:T9SS type A sorting domain-containing protein n=1 Tax=candidate division WOR-3 bacterium TaxID=2052148 RepID=A0A7C6A8D6_UNCW3
MKYLLTILVLPLVVGITLAADLTVYNNYYVTANTTYDWTLTKTADRTDLEFAPAPDPNPEAVVFTIDITRSAPYLLAQKIGTISITNNGSEDVVITRVKDSIAYHEGGIIYPGVFVDDTVLFEGSHTIAAGATWNIPFVFAFTTNYPLGPNAYHYNYAIVLTNGNELFLYVDAFHTTPTVVNETLYVWDEFIIPTGFSYTWNYNGPWTEAGSNTHTINVSITNQSATSGTYQAVNYAFGSNECGFWADTVVMEFHVTPPPDSEWHGYTYTPGYWKNHPDAFDQWLPVTIAGVTVSTVSQARTILNRSGQSNSPWYKFLCHFLATKFNTLNDPGLLSVYYNNKTQTGEFMEGLTVGAIMAIADGYTQSTPSTTLLAMKDVFDAINNNATTHVLWLTNSGGSGKTISLPSAEFFTLSPNPFNNRTEIRFLTEVKEPVTLSVYDISGAKVRDLIKNANSTLYWDGTDNNGRRLTRGVYFIRCESVNPTTTLKALINR